MTDDPTTFQGLEDEGVIRFEARHQHTPLSSRQFDEQVRCLTAWRSIFVRLGLVGQAPHRYRGAGFGNLSARVGPFPGSRGARPFVISGTQTGGIDCIQLEHYAWVNRYDLQQMRVHSKGLTLPSSEAMTHAAIYDLSPSIRYVFHVHSPLVWKARQKLSMPTTSPDVPYGTIAMAREVRRLSQTTALLDRGILAMAGHTDGIIAFGKDPAIAAQVIIESLAKVLSMGPSARVCNNQFESAE